MKTLDISNLKAINEKKQNQKAEKTTQHDLAMQNLETQRVIVKAFESLVRFMENNVSKTQVVNQLKEIGTPDALKVVEAVENLDKTLQGKEVDFSKLTDIMKSVLAQVEKIPKELPKLELPKQIDHTKQFESFVKAIECVEKAVKAQKTVVQAPQVTIGETTVKVSAQDLKPLSNDLEKAFIKAIKGIVFPKQVETDLSTLEKEQVKQTKLLKEIRDKPVSSGGGGGGRATPYEDSNGIPAFVELTVDGKIPVEAGATSNYESRNDTTTDVNLVYLGKAVPGSNTSDSAWQIKRYNKSAGHMAFADAEATFDKTWDDRTSYSY